MVTHLYEAGIEEDFFDEKMLQDLYSLLPPTSKGKTAENPRAFAIFRRIMDRRDIERDVISFALLCLDESVDAFTWHLHCGRYSDDFNQIFTPCQLKEDIALRRYVEQRLSNWRGRGLK